MQNKTPNFQIGCTSWAGVLLSISIIAIRAFQPAAQPIESWSAFSWFLMLLPVLLPIVAALAFVVVMALWAIVVAILD